MTVQKNITVTIINIIFIALNINAKTVPFEKLSLGDIITINNLDEFSNEIHGHVFNGHHDAKFSHQWDEIKSHKTMTFLKKICLNYNSAVLHFFPRIFVNKEKFLNVQNVFHNTDRVKDKLFPNDLDLIDDGKFSYGIIKVCGNIHTHYMKIKMIEKNETSKIDDSKYYVSYVVNGRCLFQVFVNNKDFCDKIDHKSKREAKIQFFNSSISKSLIITTDNNVTVDNSINDYLIPNNDCLFSFKTLPLNSREHIFDTINKDIIIDLHLHSLPKLIELPGNHHKSMIRNKLMMNLQPGDMINVDDLFKFDESYLSVDSLSVEKKSYQTAPITSIIYANCSTNETDFEKLYNYYPEIDLFGRVLKRKHYGVDPKYLNANYRCLKVTICNSFDVVELKSSIKLINVNEHQQKNISQYKLFFDRENVIIRFEAGNATHYITKADKGDCLFQALMFPAGGLNEEVGYEDSGLLLNYLLYTGEIISASNNRTLENWTRNLINVSPSTIDKSLGLINFIKNNITDLVSIWRELDNNDALMSLQLHPFN